MAAHGRRAGGNAGITVVSADDWARIAAYGQPKQMGPAEQLKQRRRELHEKSKADVDTWSNTVAGQRKLRLTAKSEREKAREAAQVALDLEEAKFQAQKRKDAIRRAKVQMLKQTDLMKDFHGAMVLTETVNGRARQTNFKSGRQHLLDEVEEKRRLAMIADIKQAEEDELAKLKKARTNAMDVAAHHLERAAENRAARRKERQAQLDQQAAIDEDYVNFLEEEKATYETRRAKTMKCVEERKLCDARNKKLFAHRTLLQEVEDEKAGIAKERTMEMRDRMKANELADRKAAIKRREVLAEQLAVIEADHSAEEAARNAAYQAEKFRLADEADALKAKKRAGAVAEILEHRQEVMAQKVSILRSEMEADYREREEVEADLQVAAEYEAKLEVERRKRNRTLLNIHGAKIAEHEKEVAAARQQLLDDRTLMNEQLDREKAVFKGFATRTMKAAEAAGESNVVPIVKAINALDWRAPLRARPHLPTFDNRRRGNPYPGNSKKRIGMNWDGSEPQGPQASAAAAGAGNA